MLAAGAIFYYAVLYTIVLKRHTRHSTHVRRRPWCGTGAHRVGRRHGLLDWPAIVFFGVVFCRQLPALWALAMRFPRRLRAGRRPDAAARASPMSVGRQTVVWTWLTVAVSLTLWPVAGGYGIGWIYTRGRRAAGCWFVVEAHRLLRRIRRDAEMKPMLLFHVSISYLALLLGRDHRRQPDLRRRPDARPRCGAVDFRSGTVTIPASAWPHACAARRTGLPRPLPFAAGPTRSGASRTECRSRESPLAPRPWSGARAEEWTAGGRRGAPCALDHGCCRCSRPCRSYSSPPPRRPPRPRRGTPASRSCWRPASTAVPAARSAPTARCTSPRASPGG